MRPRLEEVMAHPDGRIRICPEEFARSAHGLLGKLDEPRDRFVLIGRRQLRSNNSWMHNVANLVSGPPGCTAQVNTDDADDLALGEGDLVRMTSAVGEVIAEVEVTDDLLRGVVSLPHGWGHDAADAQLGVAVRVAGVNANALTDDAVLDAYSGNAVFNGVPVGIAPVNPSA